ncbi:hypothetical protein SAY86_019362 [Trapa natans]|uniref:RPW8 domain-containing protein n=1 Tax=Trapa natans TaxID=22666 RepID=A0AAN7R6T0_TRANT|nr:hypothetical protein SAY86_019362 [Trapa natans]
MVGDGSILVLVKKSASCSTANFNSFDGDLVGFEDQFLVMAELVTGSVLGTLTSQLLLEVRNGVKTCIMFGSHLKCLESTLEYINPIVENMDASNYKEEILPLHKLMEDGTALVTKARGISIINIFQWKNYSAKMKKLESDILKFLNLYVIAVARDIRNLQDRVKDMQSQITNMYSAIEDMKLKIDDMHLAIIKLPI